MEWSDVGEWIKSNAGSGAALVGSLLTGNVHGAVAAGVALVSGATGTNDPTKALQSLQNDPATVIRLRELAVQEDASIRAHIEAMTEAQLKAAKIETDDRDSARKREVSTNDKTPKIIASIILVVWGLLNYVLFTEELPAGSEQLVARVLGTIDAALMVVLSYYFGTSASSAAKNETIAIAMKK